MEINNPGVNYRVGTKEIVDDFINTGIVRAGEHNAQKNNAGRFLLRKETFTNPMFKQGSLWYQPSEEMSGLLTTSEPLITATKSSAPVANNGIFTIEGKTFANDFGGRRIPSEGQVLDASNTSAFIYEPNYGYRKVTSEVPTISWPSNNSFYHTYLDGKPEYGMYLTPDKKAWDMKTIYKDLAKGIADTQLFLGSDVKATSDLHNIELAKRIGFPHFSPYRKAQERASVFIKPQFVADRSKLAGSINKNLDPSLDRMSINIFYDADKGGFHETLHRGNYGEAGFSFDPKTMDFMTYHQIQDDTRGFYDFKTNKLLVPRTKENAEWYDYMSRSAEAATNSLELGRRMGVAPGTLWPGRDKALNIFKKYSTSNDEKTNAFNVLNWKNKPRRVWDAITGRYFTIGLGIEGAEQSLNQNK